MTTPNDSCFQNTNLPLPVVPVVPVRASAHLQPYLLSHNVPSSHNEPLSQHHESLTQTPLPLPALPLASLPLASQPNTPISTGAAHTLIALASASALTSSSINSIPSSSVSVTSTPITTSIPITTATVVRTPPRTTGAKHTPPRTAHSTAMASAAADSATAAAATASLSQPTPIFTSSNSVHPHSGTVGTNTYHIPNATTTNTTRTNARQFIFMGTALPSSFLGMAPPMNRGALSRTTPPAETITGSGTASVTDSNTGAVTATVTPVTTSTAMRVSGSGAKRKRELVVNAATHRVCARQPKPHHPQAFTQTPTPIAAQQPGHVDQPIQAPVQSAPSHPPPTQSFQHTIHSLPSHPPPLPPSFVEQSLHHPALTSNGVAFDDQSNRAIVTRANTFQPATHPTHLAIGAPPIINPQHFGLSTVQHIPPSNIDRRVTLAAVHAAQAVIESSTASSGTRLVHVPKPAPVHQATPTANPNDVASLPFTYRKIRFAPPISSLIIEIILEYWGSNLVDFIEIESYLRMNIFMSFWDTPLKNCDINIAPSWCLVQPAFKPCVPSVTPSTVVAEPQRICASNNATACAIYARAWASIQEHGFTQTLLKNACAWIVWTPWLINRSMIDHQAVVEGAPVPHPEIIVYLPHSLIHVFLNGFVLPEHNKNKPAYTTLSDDVWAPDEHHCLTYQRTVRLHKGLIVHLRQIRGIHKPEPAHVRTKKTKNLDVPLDVKPNDVLMSVVSSLEAPFRVVFNGDHFCWYTGELRPNKSPLLEQFVNPKSWYQMDEHQLHMTVRYFEGLQQFTCVEAVIPVHTSTLHLYVPQTREMRIDHGSIQWSIDLPVPTTPYPPFVCSTTGFTRNAEYLYFLLARGTTRIKYESLTEKTVPFIIEATRITDKNLKLVGTLQSGWRFHQNHQTEASALNSAVSGAACGTDNDANPCLALSKPPFISKTCLWEIIPCL